jgi:hypothetical protein
MTDLNEVTIYVPPCAGCSTRSTTCPPRAHAAAAHARLRHGVAADLR